MTRPVTVYDIARRAGVSTATISRYFRWPDRVAAATRERIREVVQEAGYLPSGTARGLVEGRTGSIGLYTFYAGGSLADVEPDAFDFTAYPQFHDEVLRGVEFEASRQGTPLLVGWDVPELALVPPEEVARRVDGLVVLPQVIPEDVLRHLARVIPLVLVAQRSPDDLPLSTVTVENAAGMQELVRHLTRVHGYSDLRFVGVGDNLDTAERFSGYRAGLREAGVPVPDRPDLLATTRELARDRTRELLAAGERPQAIVCASDQSAFGVIDACRERGLSVPGDVAVTGFDGVLGGEIVRPQLTTVRQPMPWLGITAVQLLQERLRVPDAEPVHRTLPVRLVVRQSCGCRQPGTGSGAPHRDEAGIGAPPAAGREEEDG